jgi:hypothetical protein
MQVIGVRWRRMDERGISRAPAAQQTLFSNANDMITSHRTFGLLCGASLLISGTFFQAPQACAADSDERYANERISIEHARPATIRRWNPTGKRKSAVAQAAAGRVVEVPPEAPLDGTLVEEKVAQAGYLGGCGPACDCGNCATVCPPGAGRGVEVGCGIGAALNRLGPSFGVVGRESVGGVEEIYVEGGCGIEPAADCSCDACTGCAPNHIPVSLPLLRCDWNRFDFFAGVQGYKGPLSFANTDATNANERKGSGSFGFYQGFNEGRPLCQWLRCDMAAQFGLRATQSNMSGAEFTNETRHQVFLTGGVFRKVDCGMQYGLVVDYLNDDWYFQGDSVQLRGEFSWRNAAYYTWGFQFMAGLSDETSTTSVIDGSGNLVSSSIDFEPTDQYRLFYRRLLKQSGQWSAFAGWTDRDDGLLGADLSLPLRRCLVLSTSTTYLIPREGSSSGGNEEEGWNISLGLVYRPGGPQGSGRYYRPMFDVADNGTFMIDRK